MLSPIQRTQLVVRFTITRAGAVRIEHAYQTSDDVDRWELWSQVPSGAGKRIRTVWNELRVLLAIWLERERAYDLQEEEQVPQKTQ